MSHAQAALLVPQRTSAALLCSSAARLHRSLKELLRSHRLVKVQVNGAKGDDAAVAAVAAQLAQQAAGDAQLLQVRVRMQEPPLQLPPKP